MKKLFLFFAMFAGIAIAEINLPLDRTALILGQGEKEIGLFHPFVLGKTENTQYSMHPILEFVIPNVEMKKTILHERVSNFAWTLKFSYPSPLLKMIQKKGIGGFIAPDPDFDPIPHILTVKIDVLNTRAIFNDHLLTFSGGMGYTVTTGRVDPRITIDLPWIYPRMNQYNNPLSVSAGIHFTGPVWKKIGYDSGGEFTYTSGDGQNISFEFSDYFFWQATDRLKVYSGYDLFFAEYPFGSQWHFFPMIDLRYSW